MKLNIHNIYLEFLFNKQFILSLAKEIVFFFIFYYSLIILDNRNNKFNLTCWFGIIIIFIIISESLQENDNNCLLTCFLLKKITNFALWYIYESVNSALFLIK